MDSKAASASNPSGPQAGPQQQVAQIQATAQRAFSRTTEDGPPPLFVNNVEFSGVGMDVYMDVGTVSPESIRDAWASKPGAQQPTVRFNVDFRFGMSIQTVALMLQRLTALVQASTAQAISQQAPASVEESGLEDK